MAAGENENINGKQRKASEEINESINRRRNISQRKKWRKCGENGANGSAEMAKISWQQRGNVSRWHSYWRLGESAASFREKQNIISLMKNRWRVKYGAGALLWRRSNESNVA